MSRHVTHVVAVSANRWAAYPSFIARRSHTWQ
jgi:hypothetical protein